MRNLWTPQKKGKKLSFRKAFLWILFFTITVSGTTSIVILYYFHFQAIQLQDKRYNIHSIIQTGEEKGLLSTQYLAEILELSADAASNLFGYKTDAAIKKLLSSPIIKSAKVNRIKPDALSVEYSLRNPRYCLADYSNTGIDDEGVLLPLAPFFENKNLVEVCLGIMDFNPLWGEKLPDTLLKPLLEIAEEFEHLTIFETLELRRIDVSRANASSFGGRQIVLVCTDQRNGSTWYLRLRNSELKLQLRSFETLFQTQYPHADNQKSKVIDLRLPRLAYAQDL